MANNSENTKNNSSRVYFLHNILYGKIDNLNQFLPTIG
jgi:hypothetical protein